MKIRSFSSPDAVSRQNVPRNIPRMRCFGPASNQNGGTLTYRRSNLLSPLYDGKDTSVYTSPSDQYSSVHSTFGTINSTSQYKVSEIVNPDGTVTVRNLVVKGDGSWECQEEERDYNVLEKRPASRSSATKSYNTMSSQSNNAVQSQITSASNFGKQKEETIPELTSAASFGSSRSSTSSETMITAKIRSDASEMSEGAAHNLRRQRLARTRRLGQAYGISDSPPPTTSNEPPEHSPSSSMSLASSESSHVMMLMRSPVGTRNSPPPPPPTTEDLDSPPRPRRTTTLITPQRKKTERSNHSKHVAFLEPTQVDTTTSMTSSSYDETGEDDSSGYPGSYSLYDDEESSVFRDVITPSPDGNKKIVDILGPPPASPVMVFTTSSVEDVSTRSNRIKSSSSSKERPTSPKEAPLMNNAVTAHHTHQQEEEEQVATPYVHTVTVHKVSQMDKIGIFVGLKKFSYGTRLVVSRVIQDGKFATSGVSVGDIVMSINGNSMIENPSSQEALEIVRVAKDRVTFVIQKHGETEDVQSIDRTSISSISRDLGFMSTPDRIGRNFATPGTAGQTSPGRETFKKKMTSDGNMVIFKDSEFSVPTPVKANESWKLSGAIVVVVKKTSPSQKPGLRLGTKESPTGRVLSVAEISSSGPFVQTPLRVGDVILSINDVDFDENADADVVDAYAALEKTRDQISVVARKAEESLNEFLQDRNTRAKAYAKTKEENTSADKPIGLSLASPYNSSSAAREEIFASMNSEGFSSPKEEYNHLFPGHGVDSSPPRKSFDFDEELYGASLHGYNSSKTIKIVKLYPKEYVGLDLVPVQTEWGRLLIVANIVPKSKAAATKIRVGDAILDINGVDFRDNPDVEGAVTVMKRARRDVNIEIQQLSTSPTTLSAKELEAQEEITAFEPESVGVVRTRTFDSNDDFLDQTGALKIAKNLDSDSSQRDRVNESTRTNAAIASGRQREGPTETTQGEEDQNTFTLPKPKQYRKVWVIVTKDYPSEKVGIAFASFPGKLIVTDVSPSGLLRGTPVLPGDTILSINNVDFSENPDAEYAYHLVTNEPKEIIFEILKTGYSIGTNKNETKSCLGGILSCGRRRKHEKSKRQENDGDTLSLSMIDQDTVEV